MKKTKQPKCIILRGIPTSGKSTFAKKLGITILSADDIRNEFSPKKYTFNKANESVVWRIFDTRLNKLVLEKEDFIIDNTNISIHYIYRIINNLSKDYRIELVQFNIPLWKAYFRNIKRMITSNKFIPFKIIDHFNNSLKRSEEIDEIKFDKITYYGKI